MRTIPTLASLLLALACSRPPAAPAAPTADPALVARLQRDVLDARALVPSQVDVLLADATALRSLSVPEAHVGSAAVAMLLLAKGDPAGAEAAALEALGRSASAGNRLVLARTRLARAAFAEAEAGFRTVLAESPGHAAATEELGRLLFDRGRFQDALPLLETTAKATTGKDAAPAWRRVGLARTALSQVDGAADALQRALAADPTDRESHLGLAELFLATNRADLALAAFTEASKLGAEPSATCGLARAIDRLGDPAKAAPLYDGCANSDPARPEAWVGAAQAWEKSGDRARALARYQRFVEVASRDPSKQQAVADALGHVNRLAAAQPGTPSPAKK